jgi:hypothetical protein
VVQHTVQTPQYGDDKYEHFLIHDALPPKSQPNIVVQQQRYE